MDEHEIPPNPHPTGTPEFKRYNRRGGIVLIVLGLIFGGVSYYTWHVAGYIFYWILLFALAFTGVGLYALITGKMPSSKDSL